MTRNYERVQKYGTVAVFVKWHCRLC